jgi:hypothetical protein
MRLGAGDHERRDADVFEQVVRVEAFFHPAHHLRVPTRTLLCITARARSMISANALHSHANALCE